MQVRDEGGRCGGWRLQLVDALRQAVIRAQAINVRRLMNEGAPLVSDKVSDFITFYITRPRRSV